MPPPIVPAPTTAARRISTTGAAFESPGTFAASRSAKKRWRSAFDSVESRQSTNSSRSRAEPGREPDFRIRHLRMPDRALLTRKRCFVLLVRDERGVAGFCRTCVCRVLVRRALVLDRRIGESAAFEQHVREQVAGLGRGFALREGVEQGAIPACRGIEIDALARRLRACMVVLGEIAQIVLEMACDFRGLRKGARGPVRGAERIAFDESLLALEHAGLESALSVCLDRPDLQQRRLLRVGAADRERGVRVGRVLIAFLLEIEITERGIEQVHVDRIAASVEQLVERGGSFEVRHRDCDHPQGVVDELVFRPAQLPRIHEPIVGTKLAIEQREERFGALLAARLLEQRPAVLVERLIEIARIGARRDHRSVRGRRCGVTTLHEQDLAAPELRLREPGAVRVSGNEPAEHFERGRGLERRFVRTRELIHDRVATFEVRRCGEQLRIEIDGFAQRRGCVRGRIGAARFLITLEQQVREPAQCLCTQSGFDAIECKKAPIRSDRLLRGNVTQCIAFDLDFSSRKIAQRSGRLGFAGRCRSCAEHRKRSEHCAEQAQVHRAPSAVVAVDARS
jgi:hypothetical protein